MKIFDGVAAGEGKNLKALKAFCAANLDKFCAEDTLSGPLAQVCECIPDRRTKPAHATKTQLAQTKMPSRATKFSQRLVGTLDVDAQGLLHAVDLDSDA